MNELTKTPRVSVVVPCKGSYALLERCLESLHRQEYDGEYEVVVVDGWMDDGVARVASKHPRVRLVRSDERLLPCTGRNLGVQHAAGEYIVFTDADCVADAGFIAAAVRTLDEGARLVGGPVLDALPCNPFAVSDNFSQFADFPATRPEGEAEYFPGCNMAIRRDDFLSLGGFPDTKMPAGEDTLLCLAAAQRWPGGIRFVPDMKVAHAGRTSLSGYLKHQVFFGYCRGTTGIKVRPMHRRLGRWAVMALPISAKRLWYFTRRTAQWNRRGLVRLALLLPLIVPGLLAWSWGFRRACLEDER